jgi:hypothetical protein
LILSELFNLFALNSCVPFIIWFWSDQVELKRKEEKQ